MSEKIWIGIDTGGTFTDVVMANLSTGEYQFRKVASNPQEPAEAVLRGLKEILSQASVTGEAIDLVALGTTLATNAVLEGKTGRAALLTTEGFKDVLDIARQRRPHLYNLSTRKPRTPIPNELRIEIPERVDASGTVVVPLDKESVRTSLKGLVGKVDAVAVCFLHSYRNPDHERAVREIAEEVLPGIPVTLSSDVNSEFREYERFSTTSMNGALLPIMHRYLETFSDGVKKQKIPTKPYVIQSSGGLVSPQTLQKVPINTFFSGPAGGVVGAARLARAIGIRNIITFDIGGTSTDVCLVKDGEPQRTYQQQLVGLPVRTPSIDLHTIGAGGGSIAWVDPGGLPKVGPQSAGARPGPAAYGRGGALPTLTDANVVLGRLNPVSLLDGAMPIDAEAASKAIRDVIAAPLNLTMEKAAAGVLEIATLNMTGAVRVISVERGEDPRNYAIVAFGGGGPLHAAEVAESMEISTVIVPPHPGLLSAMGLLSADIRGDFGQTCLTAATEAGLGVIQNALDNLHERALAWTHSESLTPADVNFQRLIELRYAGQSSELPTDIEQQSLTVHALQRATEEFHRLHRARFGYALEGRTVEAVAVRLVAVAKRPELPDEKVSSPQHVSGKSNRSVWFREAGYVQTPVHQRKSLAVGEIVEGPAILEQMDTTTVVPPFWAATVDQVGNVILRHDRKGD